MKRFLFKTGVFIVLIAGTIYLYILLCANDSTDPFYYRFTTGKHKSLVLGTSRAAQGIDPGILNEMLHLNENKIFNYSFTFSRTPWGEPYRYSIMKKLDTLNNSSGLFILECNLWAFCSNRNQVGVFNESRTAPNNIRNPALQPNVEYFFGGYEALNFRLLLNTLFERNSKNQNYVNKDGRFVVNLTFDSMEIVQNIKERIKAYERMTMNYAPDNLRMRSFVKTIKYLRKYGTVYLIRMPISEEMLQLEDSFYPEFNSEMNKVSKELGVPYVDFTHLSNKYITSDGNHLHNDWIVSFNKLLASEILKGKEKNIELRKEN